MLSRKPIVRAACGAAITVFIFACSRSPRSAADSAGGLVDSAGVPASAAIGADPGASVVMRDASGRDLGTLTLTDTPAGIAVAGLLRGLPPGAHALHLHTVGLCQPPFESAGAHWNPTNRQHGRENPQGQHLGDLTDVSVLADSSVSVSVTTVGGTLRGPNPLFDADGAAVVIHAAADDNRTDPSGNSGDRVACGAAAGR